METLKRYPRIAAALLLSLTTLLVLTAASPAEGRGVTEPDGTPEVGLDEFLGPDYPLGGVVGNAGEVLGEGEANDLSVLTYGPSPDDFLVVVRNNTGRPVGGIEATVRVRDADGALIGVGASQGQRYPAYVPDGGVAITEIAFDGVETIPTDAEFEFDLTSRDVPDGAGAIVENDIVIDEVSVLDDSIIGTGTNAAGQEGVIPILQGACFDNDGEVTSGLSGSVNPSRVAAGDTVTFSIDLPESGCDYYLISIVA